MSLIYITGISGSGKTTIQKELLRRGYKAYDADEDGITSWQNIKTGKLVDRPDGFDDRTKGWHRNHSWNMSKKKIEDLVMQAEKEHVFLCGTASNRYDLWQMFDKVFCLTLYKNTLKHRLATRTNNSFGKHPDELSDILGWHKSSEEEDRQAGAIMINAARPVTDVVDEIIDVVSNRVVGKNVQ